MLSYEMKKYIENRNYELNSEEILNIIDVSKNPQINHIIYENNLYKVWDKDGNYFEFKNRTW